MTNSTTRTPVIYGLHNGDGVIRYVGLTSKSAETRLHEHTRDANVARLRDYPVYRWIRREGTSNIHTTVLEYIADIKDLGVRERFWIAYYRAHGHILLNCNDGGLGGWLGTEASAKTSAKLRGVPKSAEHRAKLSAAKMGKPSTHIVTDEYRAKLSAAHKGKQTFLGKTHTAETKAQMAQTRAAWWDDEKRAKASQNAKSPEGVANLSKGNHTRWHLNRGVVKEGCEFCGRSN